MSRAAKAEKESQSSSHYVYCPGRVCLFGEHSDWAGGMRRFNPDIPVGRTIVCGTNVGIHARTRALPTLLTVSSTDENGGTHGPFSVPMDPASLLAAAREGNFFSYAAGVAYHMLTHYRVGGLEIDNFQTDLPLKKGLSSSAAFCVLVVRAFDRAYNLRLTVRGEMECAFAGERLTPSQCGRMDQACANGSRPVLMTYDGDFLDVEPISVSEPLHLLLVDLKAKKNTVRILQVCMPMCPLRCIPIYYSTASNLLQQHRLCRSAIRWQRRPSRRGCTTRSVPVDTPASSETSKY